MVGLGSEDRKDLEEECETLLHLKIRIAPRIMGTCQRTQEHLEGTQPIKSGTIRVSKQIMTKYWWIQTKGKETNFLTVQCQLIHAKKSWNWKKSPFGDHHNKYWVGMWPATLITACDHHDVTRAPPNLREMMTSREVPDQAGWSLARMQIGMEFRLIREQEIYLFPGHLVSLQPPPC